MASRNFSPTISKKTEITVAHEGQTLERWVVTPGDYNIGRHTDNDIVVGVGHVSRRHARLIINRDEVLIEDLGSANGTYVDGARVTACTPVGLDQKVEIGSATLQFRPIQSPLGDDNGAGNAEIPVAATTVPAPAATQMKDDSKSSALGAPKPPQPHPAIESPQGEAAAPMDTRPLGTNPTSGQMPMPSPHEPVRGPDTTPPVPPATAPVNATPSHPATVAPAFQTWAQPASREPATHPGPQAAAPKDRPDFSTEAVQTSSFPNQEAPVPRITTPHAAAPIAPPTQALPEVGMKAGAEPPTLPRPTRETPAVTNPPKSPTFADVGTTIGHSAETGPVQKDPKPPPAAPPDAVSAAKESIPATPGEPQAGDSTPTVVAHPGGIEQAPRRTKLPELTRPRPTRETPLFQPAPPLQETLTRQLTHPNIRVAVPAAQRIELQTLGEVLAFMEKGTREAVAAYPLAALLAIFQKVCDAVAFAHSRRIIHTALHPARILIGHWGEVFVTHWEEATFPGVEVESPGHPAGKGGVTASKVAPHFVAPEQITETVSKLDERADIYSLGAILYNILTLRTPFDGPDAGEVAANVFEGRIEIAADANTPAKGATPGSGAIAPHCPGKVVPEHLSAVAMKALSRDPARRYKTVKELQAEIIAYQSWGTTSAQKGNLRRRLSLLFRSHKLLVLALSLTVALVAAAVYTYRSHWRSLAPRTEPSRTESNR